MQNNNEQQVDNNAEPATKEKKKLFNPEVMKPECPVCLSLPFNAFIGSTCGHSICQTCKEKISQCPVCRKFQTFVPNYMLRQLINENPSYAEELKQLEEAYILTTPQGIIKKLTATYPDFAIISNNFDVDETAFLLKLMDDIIHNRVTGSLASIREQYNVPSLTYIACQYNKSWYHISHAKGYYLCCRFNNLFYYISCHTKFTVNKKRKAVQQL